ncbi:Metallo-dependent phosphatase-like protein [Glomus cerebriforme]|uniref:Sphingomyelin phosphodiesterase n=1 Tax=Glomus cerebriforme TaxID=658196 RepID=A0A397TK74_9GLOM|nr:Metallo-dependent phosphatase-like protein [Glomus cerebriforme]
MSNATQAITIQEGIFICTAFKIQPYRVCAELLPKFGPWAMTVLANSVFSADSICSKAHFCPKPDHPKPDLIELPPRPSKSVESTITTTNESFQDDERMWVVHLSDWHFDSEYSEGYEVNCGEPVCCRPPNAFGDEATSPAGKWGDYNCDIPRRLIESMLEFIPNVVPKIDYVLSTGDLPPHDVWAETPSSIKEITNKTANIWHKFFSSVPYFPVIGNHESAPVNSFPTSSLNNVSSISWLYDLLSTQWNIWLREEARESIEKRGFYSARIPKDNMRIIALNTNFWYKFNWWMLMRPESEWDPENMLKWVIEELYEAEKLGEKVWILGHMIALSEDSFPSFSSYFSQIVARFNDTITGQFYGHTHWDEFQVIYDSIGNHEPRPVGVGYMGPSVTTFKNLNPAFRVYEINKSTKKIINHYTYYLDIEEANRNNKPDWKLLYDAKSLYKLQDLEPQSWHDLSERFLTDNDAYQTFKKIASRNQTLNKYGSCKPFETSQQCKNRIICRLRSTFSGHGPFLSNELCKKPLWMPQLPENWRLTAAFGKTVNVLVNIDKFAGNGDEDNGDSLFKLQDDNDNDKSGYGENKDDDNDDGDIMIEGLSKILVRMVLELVSGDDNAICR